jgi:hypothetical protein
MKDCALMNILSRDKQIEVIAALCEGVGIRAASRLTGVNRGTVGTLALRVGMGCMELHDRLMVGIRTDRCELAPLSTRRWRLSRSRRSRYRRNAAAGSR